MRPRIIVPPYETLVEMPTADLLALRVELVDASESIQNQIQHAEHDGTLDPIWAHRSNTALSHMRRGLATIKAELARRNGKNTPAAINTNIQHAFNAIDEIRHALKRSNELYAACQALLEDDSDENWARLEELVNNGNMEPLPENTSN